MTTGAVGVKLFGPPLESTFTPKGGWLYGPGGEVLNSPNGMVNHHGKALGRGPSGFPLMVPWGCDSDGPRELLKSELDHNMITQYPQFLMFMGSAGQSVQFSDGTDNYASWTYLSQNASTQFLVSGFYVMPTTVALPTGEVSAITMASGSSIFMGTSSGYIIPSSPGFTVSSYTASYGQTYASLTTSLTAGSASFNVAQIGLVPARYNTTNAIYLLAGGASPNTFTAFTSYTNVPTTPVAISTTYQLSQTYTVPASGAITFEYTITATL